MTVAATTVRISGVSNQVWRLPMTLSIRKRVE